MKRLIGVILLLFTISLVAQTTSNSWIDYSQTYYKFPVAENGIYRVPYQVLVNSGIPLSTIDARNFQVFTKGKEIPIYLKGENDGVFNPTDYIEFYAEGNDGWLDTVLYKSKANQPNPYYSLINDTISYYITWNNSLTNSRYTEENAIDFSNYFNAAYIWKESVVSFNQSYYNGKTISGGGTDPEYVPTEGYMAGAVSLGNSTNYTLPTPNRYTSGPFVDFEFQMTGQSDFASLPNGDHHIRLTVGNQVFDRVFEGYQLLNFKRSFSPAEIIGGNNTVRFQSIDDLGSSADRNAMAYMKITYPQTMSLSNNSYYEFLVEDAPSQNAQYLELLFFRGGSSPILYDLTNNKKIRIVETLSNYKTIIPNGNGMKRCVVLSDDEVKTVSTLVPVEANGRFTNYSSQILDSTYLILTHTNLVAGASNYAIYRQSQGLPSKVIDVENLYDQYGYGIPKNPLAIRAFMQDAFANWNFPPTHLFLIGKSVNLLDQRKSGSNYSKNLVPTIGNPATDNLLIAGLNGTNLEPPIPIGRLSAKTNAEVGFYLNKVIEYESAPAEKWMKEALHFAGGKSTFEANLHENYLNGFAQSLASLPFGGNTRLFRKSTSAPFQISLSDSIRSLINNGVSMLTFFGHSTGDGEFDISIDTPDKLQNKGRYHVLMANSCFAGNTHQPNVISTSEKYVLEREKGAIAFIANGNLGLRTSLNTYSSAFYQNFANKNYGKSLAENMRRTVIDVQQNNVQDQLKSVCLEMTLQGDPALVLNAQPLPDYSISTEGVKVNPEQVTTDLDSFKLRVRIDNIGRATSDSVLIQIVRDFPLQSANDTTYSVKLAPIDYERFIDFSFPTSLLKGIGMNKFSIRVDPLDEINELSNTNNQVNIEVLIRSGEVIPVYPYDYSIVGEQAPALKASTAFAFEEETSYIFEIDTSAEFNSLLKPSFTTVSSGGVVSWQPSVLQNMPDSAVYFWRVSKLPNPGGVFNWRTSSFQYIPNESGWAQDHFDQFNKNDYLFVRQNQSINAFEFVDNLKELTVQTIGNPTTQDLNSIYYAVDADIRERQTCFGTPAFLIAVLDSLTFDSWETPYLNQNQQNNFGQANNLGNWCRDRPEAVFNFQTTKPQQMLDMRDFLSNSIPDNSVVIIYTWLQIDYDALDTLDPTILQSISNLGSNLISTVPNGYPFIFTVKKGDLNSVEEVVGSSATERIEVVRTLKASAEYGESTSIEIGPSTDFKRLSYRFSPQESNSADEVEFKLIGIDIAGRSSELYRSSKLSLDTAAAPLIDGKIFRKLKLSYQAQDNALQTIPQLERWHLNYTELPDAALSPNVYFKLNKDTLQQGEQMELEIGIVNVSKSDMDSLEVRYQVLTDRNQLVTVANVKTAPLKGDSMVIAKVNIATNSFVGKNTLLIEVNPNLKQLELNTFNNVGQLDFYVNSDQLNPLLEVTFDGRHILNREIISSKPLINISLRDDNSFLALDDTSSLAIYLSKPNGQEELLNYGANSVYELMFRPASLPENKASVTFRPDLKEDGVYRLRVQGSDKSGNSSGNQDYLVEFEVVNKSTVTRLLNYPNPFSTSTQFVFTLTGSKVPDQIQIQIMTITGKVVREIDQFELGNIHIGNNITDFAWDGRDEFGDRLANGVYLYRVKMKIDGNNVERRDTKVDQYFTKDFGKMFLLR